MLIFQINNNIDEEEVTADFFKNWWDYFYNTVNDKENNVILLPPFIDYICDTENVVPTDSYTFELNNEDLTTE